MRGICVGVRNFAPATLAGRGQSLDAFFGFLSLPAARQAGSRGIDDVREVTRETVREYQLWLSSQPFTTHTVHAKLIALRRFFEHLEQTDAVLLNPCAGLRLPKLEDRLPRLVLTQAQARAVLNVPNTGQPRGLRDRALLELFYSTGIRLEEMARLAVDDLDCENGLARIQRGKGGRERVVPLGETAGGWLKEYLNVRAVWTRERRAERALWLSRYAPHRPMQRIALQRLVRDYGQKAGVARLTPHVWRHTCATHLVANGSHIAHVQRLLGHRSLTTTQIYTRVSVPDLQKQTRTAHPRAGSRATAPRFPRP